MKLSETMQSAVDCASHLDPGGQIVLIVPAWIGQLKGLEAENDRLKRWKKDVEDSTRAAMDESCDDIEDHCTCVPLLRAEIGRVLRWAEGKKKRWIQHAKEDFPNVHSWAHHCCEMAAMADELLMVLGAVRGAAEPEGGER